MDLYDKKYIKFKTFSSLLFAIEQRRNVQCKNPNEILQFNGNAIDAVRLAQTYNLSINRDLSYDPNNNPFPYEYQFYKLVDNDQPNSYAVGVPSMYGNIIYKFNIHGIFVEILQNQRSNYESSYSSSYINTLNAQHYIVLDIETTGLNPLLDDIIQICIYDNDSHYYVKNLPLIKRDKNFAYDINKIPDETLIQAKSLTQDDVDSLFEQFSLMETPIVIWTGKNHFDRLFLEIYFLEHNLSGMENLIFYNGKTYIDNIDGLTFVDFSKDNIAKIYGLDIHNAHNALTDCRLEKAIIQELISGNLAPLFGFNARLINNSIKNFLLSDYYRSKDHAGYLYDSYCNILKNKYGHVLTDYDIKHTTRGSEWIDIHHIDEITEDDIATKTTKAISQNDLFELRRLKKFNKHTRLLYANKIEHFILHCLIAYHRPILAAGPHWIFGDIIKMHIGLFKPESKEYQIQCNLKDYHSVFSFDEIIKIYANLLKHKNLSINECSAFYKLNEYIPNEIKYLEIVKKLYKDLQ